MARTVLGQDGEGEDLAPPASLILPDPRPQPHVMAFILTSLSRPPYGALHNERNVLRPIAGLLPAHSKVRENEPAPQRPPARPRPAPHRPCRLVDPTAH